MKSLKALILTLTIVMLSVSFGFSQMGGGNYPNNPNGEPMIFQVIPDITQDQKDKIITDKNDMMKTVTPLRADLKVKQAELDALMAKNSSTKDKESKVREISDLKVKIQMAQIQHHDNVRNLLTDNQKVSFDNWTLNHHSGMKGGNGMGNGNGRGNCNGKGNGYGYGRGNGNGNGNGYGRGMGTGQNQGMNK